MQEDVAAHRKDANPIPRYPGVWFNQPLGSVPEDIVVGRAIHGLPAVDPRFVWTGRPDQLCLSRVAYAMRIGMVSFPEVLPSAILRSCGGLTLLFSLTCRNLWILSKTW